MRSIATVRSPLWSPRLPITQPARAGLGGTNGSAADQSTPRRTRGRFESPQRRCQFGDFTGRLARKTNFASSHVVARTANGASSDVVFGELSLYSRDDEAPWLRDPTAAVEANDRLPPNMAVGSSRRDGRLWAIFRVRRPPDEGRVSAAIPAIRPTAGKPPPPAQLERGPAGVSYGNCRMPACLLRGRLASPSLTNIPKNRAQFPRRPRFSATPPACLGISQSRLA
jgi:hypothetical protein